MPAQVSAPASQHRPRDCLTGRVILAHEAIACPGLFVAPATIPSLSSMRVVHTPYMVHVYRAHLALTFENVFALHAHAFNIALHLAVRLRGSDETGRLVGLWEASSSPSVFWDSCYLAMQTYRVRGKKG